MQASGTPTQPPEQPTQAARTQQAVQPPAQSLAYDATPTEPPSVQHVGDVAESQEPPWVRAMRALLRGEETDQPNAIPPLGDVAAQPEPPPPLPAAPEAKTPVQQPEQPAAHVTAQPEPPPKLSAASDANLSKPPPEPAAGGAAPGPSAAFKKELMYRHKNNTASAAELRTFYQDVLKSRGIAGIVAEISLWEENSIVYAEAVKVVRDLIDASKLEARARNLNECLDAGLVPTVIEAASKYRHCNLFPYWAFSLFVKTCWLADELLAGDAALESTVTRVHTELAAAADIVLTFISSQQASSTGSSCETAFEFLASLFGELKSCKPYFPHYAHQHGDRAIRVCMAVLRKCRGVSVTSDAAVETLMELARSSEELALTAVKLNAIELLVNAAPVADTLLSDLSSSMLKYIAGALCAIMCAVYSIFTQPSDVMLDWQMSPAVLDVLIVAVRLKVLADPSLVLETLDFVFESWPALVFCAVRAGALDLEDADGSACVREFVDRLKARVSDAEASAAAAAAALLADEDAAQARAAAKAAKPKRAKKPAAPAASANASPPSAESDAAAESRPSDPSPHSAGQALELSQSESAMRRRRRAATKAVRRAAAAARVQRGSKEKATADSSDDDDEERSAAGDDEPPLPASAADDVQSASPEAIISRFDCEPAVVAAPLTEDVDAPPADLFPWMAVSDSASSPAAELDTPAQATASQAEPAALAQTPTPLPSQPLPLPSSPPSVPFERFEALCADLARAKDEIACVKNELARATDKVACSTEELACSKNDVARLKNDLMLAKDELDASKCVICLSAPRCLAVLPCRHLPLCAAADCAAAMGTPPRCPLCRVGVTGAMQLYI